MRHLALLLALSACDGERRACLRYMDAVAECSPGHPVLTAYEGCDDPWVHNRVPALPNDVSVAEIYDCMAEVVCEPEWVWDSYPGAAECGARVRTADH